MLYIRDGASHAGHELIDGEATTLDGYVEETVSLRARMERRGWATVIPS